jgi:LmbE family N-acetylglucosaminyl deacetylase
MHQFIDKIIRQKSVCFFLSPHLDDALLSSGALISYLASRTPLKIVTIFTRASQPPHSLSIKAYLKQFGYIHIPRLYLDRRQEDKQACRLAGAETIHLDFIEAMCRQKKFNSRLMQKLADLIPELSYIYPTYRWHVLGKKISPADKPTLELIYETLEQLISKYDNSYIFCPFGIGNHIDHIITRQISLALNRPIILWGDQPYMESSRLNELAVDKKYFQIYSWQKNLESKFEIVSLYKSQIKALYPAGYQPKPELYFIPHKLVKQSL